MNKQYISLITDLKQSILQSRYVAARLANREQLLLYFKTGKMLSEKIAAEKWGAKILIQISEDLQKQLPGLRGFSPTNLKNMKQFYSDYQLFIFSQSPTGQLRKSRKSILKDTTSQFEAFFSISFTHHILILNKCKSKEERFSTSPKPPLVSGP
jgi:hypothetical protein